MSLIPIYHRKRAAFMDALTSTFPEDVAQEIVSRVYNPTIAQQELAESFWRMFEEHLSGTPSSTSSSVPSSTPFQVRWYSSGIVTMQVVTASGRLNLSTRANPEELRSMYLPETGTLTLRRR